MDQLQLAMMAMATTDTPWGPRDAHGRRRQLTAEELDDLADFGWHVPDLKGAIAACVLALRWRWLIAPRRPVGSGSMAGSDSASVPGGSPA